MYEKIKRLRYLLSLPIIGSFYGFLNYDNGRVFNLITEFDQALPFNQYFVIPYLLWYIFFPGMLIYFCFKDPALYKKQLWIINSGMLICYLIYIFFQTYVPRPLILENDLFCQLVKIVYSQDNPYNAFPSIHVLTCYSVLLGCRELLFEKPVLMTTGMCTSVLIIISTVFLKQHVVLDVFGAIILVKMLSVVYEGYQQETVPLGARR
ncbi:MAG: phosphatase PAP2 family protein [Bacteroidales bacterium]|nr:phosphatase PAP2 family protein [Bacteroidales bacterium]